MKSQFNSSEGPIKMVENATVLRPDSRKKNVSNFPVQLFPVDSWQKFEDAYIKGQTNDHLHYIFEQMGVAKRLGKGVFRLKLSIHLMPCCDTKTEKLHLFILNRCLLVLVRDLDVKTVCMHIQQREVLDDVTMRDISEQQTTSDKTRELIKQIQERDQDTYEKFKECLVQAEQAFLKDMLEEEEAKYAKKIEGELILLMKDILNGIWDTYLKQLDLRPLAEKIGEKVLDNASRKENLECLLKRLFGSKGINAGLKLLKEFCAPYPYITKRIDDIMGKRAEDATLLGQELFTTNVTLDINMTESTGDMKMNIAVEDPKLHFDTVGDACKAVSSAADHKIIGALFGIDCDTPKKNAGEPPWKRKKSMHSQDFGFFTAPVISDMDKLPDQVKSCLRSQEELDQEISELVRTLEQEPSESLPKKNELFYRESHRIVLNRMLPKLVLDLDVNAVSLFVQEKELLHDTTMDNILEQKTSSDKTRELIKQIQKRDPDTYKKFKECLVEAKQKFLKDLLEEEEQKILLK